MTIRSESGGQYNNNNNSSRDDTRMHPQTTALDQIKAVVLGRTEHDWPIRYSLSVPKTASVVSMDWPLVIG